MKCLAQEVPAIWQSNANFALEMVLRVSSQIQKLTSDIDSTSIEPYSIESSGECKRLVVLECRGIEPIEWLATVRFYIY